MGAGRDISSLLAVIKRGINGHAAEKMQSAGIVYGVNYGVSLHELKAAALGLGTDHELARELYTRPVREMILAAAAIADPGRVTEEELGFWADGIVNQEVAEVLASWLLCRTSLVGSIVGSWVCGESSSSLARYCGMLTAAKALALGAEFTLSVPLEEIANRYAESPDRLLRQGAEALAVRLGMWD